VRIKPNFDFWSSRFSELVVLLLFFYLTHLVKLRAGAGNTCPGLFGDSSLSFLAAKARIQFSESVFCKLQIRLGYSSPTPSQKRTLLAALLYGPKLLLIKRIRSIFILVNFRFL
jgi:hypothetical protein